MNQSLMCAAAIFSKAPANAARFAGLMAIMRSILLHMAEGSGPILQQTQPVSAVDCKSGIALFRYSVQVQTIVVDEVIPMVKGGPSSVQKAKPVRASKPPEVQRDEALRMIRRYSHNGTAIQCPITLGPISSQLYANACPQYN